MYNFWIFTACKAVRQVVEKIRSKKNTLYIEFIDSTGSYYIVLAHNSVIQQEHYYVQTQ